jgi:hypothetical protein
MYNKTCPLGFIALRMRPLVIIRGNRYGKGENRKEDTGRTNQHRRPELSYQGSCMSFIV